VKPKETSTSFACQAADDVVEHCNTESVF